MPSARIRTDHSRGLRLEGGLELLGRGFEQLDDVDPVPGEGGISEVVSDPSVMALAQHLGVGRVASPDAGHVC